MAYINNNGQIRVGVRPTTVSVPSIITNGLILNLDAGNVSSYSGTGTTWTDLSGQNNNGTLVNGVGYSSSNGGTLTFDGVNDYVNCGNSSVFNQTNALTLSTWVKINSFSSSQTLIGKQWCNGNQYSYVLYIDTGGKIVFDTANSGACNGYFSTYTSTNSLSTNTWYNIVLSFTNSSIKIYLNGQLISGSLIGINTSLFVSTAPILLGTYRSLSGNYSLMLNGSMGNTLIYNTSLSASEVLQNYNATKDRFISTSLSDSDAQAFITAASITDSTQQSAINTLVTSLKSAGIWTKMKAIYPFVGGTSAQHRFNLKDPRTVNEAFYLTLYGGLSHDSNGVIFNGTNSWLDTNMNALSNLVVDNLHLSFYSLTNNQNIYSGGEIGHVGYNSWTTPPQDPSKTIGLRIRDASSGIAYISSGNLSSSYSTTDGQGLTIGSVTSPTTYKMFKGRNGQGFQLKATSTGTNSGTLPSFNISIGKLQGYGEWSRQTSAFVSIGLGLTDTEATSLYNAVQAFQTTLGRQV